MIHARTSDFQTHATDCAARLQIKRKADYMGAVLEVGPRMLPDLEKCGYGWIRLSNFSYVFLQLGLQNLMFCKQIFPKFPKFRGKFPTIHVVFLEAPLASRRALSAHERAAQRRPRLVRAKRDRHESLLGDVDRGRRAQRVLG